MRYRVKWPMLLLVLCIGCTSPGAPESGSPAPSDEQLLATIRRAMNAVQQGDAETVWSVISTLDKSELDAQAKAKSLPSGRVLLEEMFGKRTGSPQQIPTVALAEKRTLYGGIQCLVTHSGSAEGADLVTLVSEPTGWKVALSRSRALSRSEYDPNRRLFLVEAGKSGQHDASFVRELVAMKDNSSRAQHVSKHEGQTVTLSRTVGEFGGERGPTFFYLRTPETHKDGNVLLDAAVSLDDDQFVGRSTDFVNGVTTVHYYDGTTQVLRTGAPISVTGVIWVLDNIAAESPRLGIHSAFIMR